MAELSKKVKKVIALLHTDPQVRRACGGSGSAVVAEDVECVRAYVIKQQHYAMSRIVFWSVPEFLTPEWWPQSNTLETGHAHCLFEHDAERDEMCLRVNIAAPSHYCPRLSALLSAK